MEATTTPSLGQPASGRVTYLPKGEAASKFLPERTALLVIDPVNDFLSEGGAGWEDVKTTVTMNNVIANLKRAIDGARRCGIPVVFGPMAYTAEDYADQELQRRSGINRLMFEKRMFVAGSWGADFHPELRPRADETVLLPHKSIDLFETDLPLHLRRLDTTHLVIAGMTANLCCESTGRRAMEQGLDVTFLSDAIGAAGLMAYEASIRVNYPLIANAVMVVDEFLAAVEASVQHRTEPQPGDTVVGSDHGAIGTIDQVVPPSPETPGFLRVPRGLIFSHDTYIPWDAITKRAGTQVFINIPKLLIAEMPWREAPTHQNRQAKAGPRSQVVGQLYGSHSPTAHAQPTPAES